MFFRQIFEDGLAQASYVVGSPDAERALVIDPRRDIDVYLDIAREHDLTITDVTETHIHADYLSGSRELAAKTGAALHLSAEGGPDWLYREPAGDRVRLLHDGDVLQIGEIRVDVLHVPGHTPEHLMFLLTDGAHAKRPMIALTGDFVFVGDLGRPDLLEQALGKTGSATLGARAMFASLRDKFSAIPDHVQLWPAHGAGSACGKALGAVPASTAGYERITAWWQPYVERGDVEGFTRELLADQVDAPAYFARMKRLNRDGAPLLRTLPQPSPLDAAGLRAAVDSGALVIDARPKERFQSGHIEGAISIPDESSFTTRAGWFVPDDAAIVLVAPADRVDGLVRGLVRVGLDRIAGYVDADDTATLRSRKQAPLESISAAAAHEEWQRGSAIVLDVRNALEHRAGHIPGALLVPASRLVSRLDDVPRDARLLVHCAGGGRSNSAASVLAARGYRKVADVAGGFGAWREAGNPVETGDVESPAAAHG